MRFPILGHLARVEGGSRSQAKRRRRMGTLRAEATMEVDLLPTVHERQRPSSPCSGPPAFKTTRASGHVCLPARRRPSSSVASAAGTAADMPSLPALVLSCFPLSRHPQQQRPRSQPLLAPSASDKPVALDPTADVQAERCVFCALDVNGIAGSDRVRFADDALVVFTGAAVRQPPSLSFEDGADRLVAFMNVRSQSRREAAPTRYPARPRRSVADLELSTGGLRSRALVLSRSC